MIGLSQTVRAFAAFALLPRGSTLYGILFSAVTRVAYYALWIMRRWGVFLLATAWKQQHSHFGCYGLRQLSSGPISVLGVCGFTGRLSCCGAAALERF